MSVLKSICVYCGSGPGTNPAFIAAARQFGAILAENQIRLVYGGGSTGLMGACADAALDHGGYVTGIIPKFLTDREHMLLRAQERIITPDLHERKRLMFERADAFVALPGGVGTLEELVEQLTWAQLGRHRKPIMIANIERFWDPLCALLDHMETLQFIRAGLNVNLLVAERVEDILPKLFKAAAEISEADKEMKTAEVERM
ncbi:MAG TPA: TIGR00730 family Rossman fold protein [Xanthobacteraceae bacterium]